MYLLCALIFVSPLFCNSFEHEAHQWAQHFVTASPHEGHIALNLLYWSYKRSHNILAVQKAWYNHQKLSRDIATIITHTRLNPSRHFNYSFDDYRYEEASNALIHTFHEYELSNKSYATLIDRIFDGDLQLPTIYQNYLHAIRATARQVLARTLIHELPRLQKALISSQERLSQSAHDFQGLTFMRSHTRFLEYLWEYIPQLMVQSFVQFDEKFTDLQTFCTTALDESHNFSNDVWYILETERSNFYKAYYSALYSLLHELHHSIENYSILVHDNNSKVMPYLPQPESL